ncbi:hypothetical protein D9M71_823930 [compost metagenome]
MFIENRAADDDQDHATNDLRALADQRAEHAAEHDAQRHHGQRAQADHQRHHADMHIQESQAHANGHRINAGGKTGGSQRPETVARLFG